MDHAGLPLKTVLDQLELLGGEVVPVLRKEIPARQDPGTPEAPPTPAWCGPRPATGRRASPGPTRTGATT